MPSAWIPLIGVMIFLGVLCWRSWWQRRRYGSAGVLFFRSRRWPERLRDALGVVLVLFLVGQAIRAAAWPQSLARLGLTDDAAAEIWQAIGTALLFGGIALLVIAQLNLGASWRIGIEEGGIMLTGYTLLLATRLSLALLVGAFIGIRQQVVTEEAYLFRTYGDVYRAYARRVGRFVPGIGRLR